MEKCRYAQPNTDPSKPTCNRTAVLAQIFTQEGKEAGYTLTEIAQVVCGCADAQGTPLDCFAFPDIEKNGRQSPYSK